jgi:ATP-dependent RNA helicase DDX49/DBP8
MTQAQQLALRPHVVVATPGRLCDLLRSNEGGGGEGALSRVRVLVSLPLWDRLADATQVLDEADRMLTPTFAAELNYLFSVIPIKRQTCLFTATVSPAIMELAEKPPTNGREKPFVYRVESE